MNYDVQQKKVIVVLPYLGKVSLEIRKRLHILLHIPFCQLQFIFRSSRRLRNIFHFNDKLPRTLHSHLVYKYACKGCNTIYYGIIDGHFHVRTCEHMGISHLSGKPYKNRKMTTISDHALLTGHEPNLDSFSRERSRSTFKLLTRESLLIYRDQPALNRTIRSYPLEFFNDN